MRVILLGMWGIGNLALKTLLDHPQVEVVGVVTRAFEETDSPYRNLVWQTAHDHHIPIFSFKVNEPLSLETLAALRPDLIQSAAFWQLVQEPLLQVPPLGVLNLHGSLLPKNRGVSPINWALRRDEPEVGLTLHYVDVGMDTGDIVFQQAIPVSDEDTPSTLADRVNALSPNLLERALDMLGNGQPLPRTKQNHAAETLAPRLRHADLEVDWRQESRVVWSAIRSANQPNLGAWSQVDGTEVVIWRAEMAEGAGGAPGVILEMDAEALRVACGNGSVRIRIGDVMPRGEARMPVLRVGGQFVSANDTR